MMNYFDDVEVQQLEAVEDFDYDTDLLYDPIDIGTDQCV